METVKVKYKRKTDKVYAESISQQFYIIPRVGDTISPLNEEYIALVTDVFIRTYTTDNPDYVAIIWADEK